MKLWESGFQLGHLRGVQPDKTTPDAGRFSKGTTRRWVELDEAGASELTALHLEGTGSLTFQ